MKNLILRLLDHMRGMIILSVIFVMHHYTKAIRFLLAQIPVMGPLNCN